MKGHTVSQHRKLVKQVTAAYEEYANKKLGRGDRGVYVNRNRNDFALIKLGLEAWVPLNKDDELDSISSPGALADFIAKKRLAKFHGQTFSMPGRPRGLANWNRHN